MEHLDLLAFLERLEGLGPLVHQVPRELQGQEECQVELEPSEAQAKLETQGQLEPVEGQVDLGLQVQRVLLAELVQPGIQAIPALPVQLE